MNAALSFIDIDDIKDIFKGVAETILKEAENYPLCPGETDKTIMIFQEDGIFYFTIAFINKDVVPMQILRFLETRQLDETAIELFKKYKDAIS